MLTVEGGKDSEANKRRQYPDKQTLSRKPSQSGSQALSGASGASGASAAPSVIISYHESLAPSDSLSGVLKRKMAVEDAGSEQGDAGGDGSESGMNKRKQMEC